jgi:crotonobetaine/carnitine-CoA ligase
MNEMPDSKFDKAHRLKFVACSAIPISLHKHLEERFKVPWFEVYGSTETGGDLVISATEQKELVGSGSIGRAFAHREVMIADDQDKAVTRGEIGNILVRGLGMMLGYFKNPEETQRTFRSGWYHTGDTGWQDEVGRIFFVGRSKDIIRRSGENISAVEVESVLYLMEEIKLVACIPVVDSMRGEEIKALIVLRDVSAKLDIEKAIKFCSENLAYFKVPRYWEICTDLPMTESDKIAKGQLASEKIAWKFDVFDSSIKSWITK